MNTPQPNGDDAIAPPTQERTQPKALRFVTNYGAPHPKRRRIGAACMTCRKRKTACSGERPYCETCRQNKLECPGYSNEAPTTRRRSDFDASIRRSSEAGEKLQKGDGSRRSTVSGGKSDFDRPRKAPSTASGQSPRARDALAAELEHDRLREEKPLFSGPRNRMPYFRWLGPTAIMPGFKQMVVKVKRQDNNGTRSSTDGGVLSPSLNNSNSADQRLPSIFSSAPTAVDSDARTPLNLPFYDNSPVPPSELITHLANTFFTHLGCNYPFLQRERFLRDLEEKEVDAILVDAVCALAARFSTHPLLTQQPYDEVKPTPAEFGLAFAQRAKAALVDTFACPSVAAVQAALLLAYNEFGESRDSGLWMYLGISIRMAQDLGLHKIEGLKFRGMGGPTPKMVKRESMAETASAVANPDVKSSSTAEAAESGSEDHTNSVDEQKAVEQERVDTFWAVFFLDRVVSSGTGRRSTLRDKEVEISFPTLDERDPESGWPTAFPALIRIVHLYGRAADLLNSIKVPSDITSETPERLAAMEKQVTDFYQNLSPRLHFDAVNFQHYMKAGEGTNFVLLHFWFHTLIVLLHQPTLLKTFEGKMLQLFPNSQQLSLSSAKTIADILSYSQLMDAKASLGNPFTTQPIYIAACAFLKETAEQTANSNAQSRAASPTRREANSDSGPPPSDSMPQNNTQKRTSILATASGKLSIAEQRALAKHTLLATAATQHYQLCYKALQSLETYWSGTKYILTILDQKFEGVDDPLLYTVEEGESSIEQPRPEPSFTSPGWRRKLSWGRYIGNANPFFKSTIPGQGPGGPGVDPSTAIGWTLTGTMNSPSTNLAWHYANRCGPGQLDGQAEPGSMMPLDGQFGLSGHPSSNRDRPHLPGMEHVTRSQMLDHTIATSNASHTDADLLLSMHLPFPHSGSGHTAHDSMPSFNSRNDGGSNFPIQSGSIAPHFPPYFGTGQTSIQNFDNMMIESQDVDMSMLGLEAMPWFDFDSYPTPEMMSMFDPVSSSSTAGAESHGQHHRGTPH